MTLREKQSKFAKLVPRLIDKAHEMGFEVTLGDAWRNPKVFGSMGVNFGGVYGALRSCHKIRLAIDLNLFKNGEFLEATEDHRPLGEWWEKQDPLCRWGGRFKDGNHYSFEHEGAK